MKNIQFDSLYKFLVSIGIILILSPIYVAYFIFNNNGVLLIKQDEILMLTDIAQKAINRQQDILYQIYQPSIFYIVCFALLFAFTIGIGLLLYGFGGWKNTQKDLDMKQKLENKKTEAEIRILSLQENEDRIKNDALEDANNNRDSKNIVDVNNVNNVIINYRKIEKMVAEKVKIDFLKTHEVIHGAKIGHMEYDIVAVGNTEYEKDYIFEIKYSRKHIPESFIKTVLDRTNDQAINYMNCTNKIPYRLIVFVTEEENFDYVKNKVMNINKRNNLSIIVTLKTEIANTNFYI